MSKITLDLTRNIGAIRPLHGVNNAPLGYGSLVDVSHRFVELGVPCCRLHDPNWPHPREVDIPQIFPNFDADPANPASYNFGPTDYYLKTILDTGASIVYRLGTSIEHTPRKYHTFPPKDFAKWAEVCVHVIRHYNEGWADGFHYNIRHWEIWNEPDVRPQMWDDTFDRYLDLYRVAATLIKKQVPDVKIGGYAAAGVGNNLNRQFLDMCRIERLPLDLFTWHRYAAHPDQMAASASTVSALLDEYGFGDIESHCNEWNLFSFGWNHLFKPGNEFYRKEAFERQKNEEGASFAAATLIVLQDQRLDMANYYDGQPQALFCGLFDYYGAPTKTFYAFKAFRALLDYPERVPVTEMEHATGLYALAARNPESGEMAILLSNFDGAADTCTLDLRGLAAGGAVCEVAVVDQFRSLEWAQTIPIPAGETALSLLAHQHAVYLITVKPQ